MRQALVLFKDQEAGILSQLDNGNYVFRYDDAWLHDSNKPPISLTLSKEKQEYHSDFLFPFFFNMLPEGSNKQTVCIHMRIDEKDYFGLLLTTAKYDTIGAVRVQKIESK